MPENTIAAPGTPPPGAYIVGTVLGVKKVTPTSGKTIRFLRMDDGADTHEMLIPDAEIDDYPASCAGELRIVPVRLGLREYKGVNQLSLVVRGASK